MNEALSKNLFTDTAQLYQLAKSALQSLYISQGMADTAALAGLAMSLKDFNLSNLYSQTVPVVSAPSDPNRSVWTDEAETLWEKMRADKPILWFRRIRREHGCQYRRQFRTVLPIIRRMALTTRIIRALTTRVPGSRTDA